VGVLTWFRDRALTLVLLAMFAVSLFGQLVTGQREHNAERASHDRPALSLPAYLREGHPWAALFENWESEFLQMAAFVLLTTRLVQRGSPESRRPGVREAVDVDPRRHAARPDAPWPVRRGGWVLWVYERSLGIAFLLLFVISWGGHAGGGYAAYVDDEAAHGRPAPSGWSYLGSARFWFESFQNWQSEFLSIAAMVWLAVYLRQRGSPESKPVHAPHAETGR
jgi:hypothetical protein